MCPEQVQLLKNRVDMRVMSMKALASHSYELQNWRLAAEYNLVSYPSYLSFAESYL